MPRPEMWFEVRDEKGEEALKRLGGAIREACPPGYGFALLLFTYGPNGNLFYASSADRDSVIRTMREFIAKFEGN